MNPALTGFENVMVRALAQGLPDPKASVAEVMEAVGLREAGRDRAKGYSLGMKQRLGLALALIGHPDVLLLDEPFNGLDPEGVRLVRRLLENLATQRECAVLVSSHVLDQLERLVDRYGILREGAACGPDDRRGSGRGLSRLPVRGNSRSAPGSGGA